MGNKNKVLLMGKSGAGKTSMRSIIFANYVARDTRRLGPTMNVEHSYIRFLETMVLNLWDCGGQPNYFEHYITKQRDQIFKGAEVLIFVISIETKELQDDLRLYQSCLEALTNLSPEAKVVCLVSKMDLVAGEKREQEFAAREAEVKKRSIPFKVTCYPTNIWDESLYKAWSSIIYSLVPNIAIFEASLNKFADIMRADEVLLFEKATYLIIAHAVRKKHPDIHRFEKISKIIKLFKHSASRFVANLHTMRMEIINGDLKIFLDILTYNLAIMVVVTDPLVYPAAISLNIQSARKHFGMLEKLDIAPILPFGEPKQALKLSLGEKGSLAIPDSELDVYEVHPVKVGQYSVSVPEIQLDLSDISTLDSQIGITSMEKQSYRILIHGNNAVKSSHLFERLQLSYPDKNCIEMEQARLEFYAYPDLNLLNRSQEPQIDANIIRLIGYAGNSSDCESGISLFIVLISHKEIFSRDMKRMITEIAQNKHFESERYFWDHATILFAFEEIVCNYPQEVERSINRNVGIKELVEKAGKGYFWMSNSCTKDELGASIIFQCKNVKCKSRLRYYWRLIRLICRFPLSLIAFCVQHFAALCNGCRIRQFFRK